jgi:hypothetical protein
VFANGFHPLLWLAGFARAADLSIHETAAPHWTDIAGLRLEEPSHSRHRYPA